MFKKLKIVPLLVAAPLLTMCSSPTEPVSNNSYKNFTVEIYSYNYFHDGSINKPTLLIRNTGREYLFLSSLTAKQDGDKFSLGEPLIYSFTSDYNNFMLPPGEAIYASYNISGTHSKISLDDTKFSGTTYVPFKKMDTSNMEVQFDKSVNGDAYEYSLTFTGIKGFDHETDYNGFIDLEIDHKHLAIPSVLYYDKKDAYCRFCSKLDTYEQEDVKVNSIYRLKSYREFDSPIGISFIVLFVLGGIAFITVSTVVIISEVKFAKRNKQKYNKS